MQFVHLESNFLEGQVYCLVALFSRSLPWVPHLSGSRALCHRSPTCPVFEHLCSLAFVCQQFPACPLFENLRSSAFTDCPRYGRACFTRMKRANQENNRPSQPQGRQRITSARRTTWASQNAKTKPLQDSYRMEEPHLTS